MEFNALTAISPIDGRYHDKTEVLRPIFSEYGLFRFRVYVEIAWLKHLAQHPEIGELKPFSAAELKVLDAIFDNFSVADADAIKAIEKKTNHDVKAVEYFISDQLRTHKTLSAASPFVHFACTSEDINNLSYALMLKTAREQILLPQLTALINQLQFMADDLATTAMLSRTHGQAASPTTLGKELGIYAHRLSRQKMQLSAVQLLGKLNGAVGNFNAHLIAYPAIDWPALSTAFIAGLGLDTNPHTTQVESHDYIAEYIAVLSRIATIVIDLSRDIWGYIALDYFKLKPAAAEVGSSTMPHKVNPIDFENAEGNCGIATANFSYLAQQLPISRWQRDLTDSTVLRNIGTGIGHIVIAFDSLNKGLNKLEANVTRINADLAAAWAVLAEPIQMVMRRYGITNAYEQLKAMTRGKAINQAILHEFIEQLDIPAAAKADLQALTPQSYLGNAEQQARQIAKQQR